MLVNHPKTAITLFLGLLCQSPLSFAEEGKSEAMLLKDTGTTIIKGVEGLDSVSGTDTVLIDNKELEKNSYQHPADMLQDVQVFILQQVTPTLLSVSTCGVCKILAE